METIRHGSKDLSCVRVVVQATIKFGGVKYIAVEMLMSVGKLQKKNDCAFVALVTIIKVKIVKGRHLSHIACYITLNERKTCRRKANGKKVKINAILDDASNETFFNEDVAGALGIQEPYEKVKVHVLNDSVETFESMLVTVQIERVDGQCNFNSFPQQGIRDTTHTRQLIFVIKCI